MDQMKKKLRLLGVEWRYRKARMPQLEILEIWFKGVVVFFIGLAAWVLIFEVFS